MKILGVILTIAAFIISLMLNAVFCAGPVWLLWNWLMPELFGLCQINLFQAYGLCWLCGLLFKSGNNKKKEKN